MSEARGRTSEGGAVNRNWFVDSQNPEAGYSEIADIFDGLALGDTVEVEECAVVSSDFWQLIPVEEDGKPCRCGKTGGCGDFLGVDCHAEREMPIKLDDLPKKWRTL